MNPLITWTSPHVVGNISDISLCCTGYNKVTIGSVCSLMDADLDVSLHITHC